MIIERVLQLIEFKGLNKSRFYKDTGLSNGFLDKVKDIGSSKLEDILNAYPDINPAWLITGKGEMIGTETIQDLGVTTMIPLYNDVATIGGTSSVADMNPGQPSEWINAGDWFRDATAAIRHYGDSMSEYPSGAILALREVMDRRIILWGRNYCIETNEVRITKKLQKGDDLHYVVAHSTNKDVYPDGSLIHQPIDIPVDAIRKLFLILGCVTKEYSSGSVGVNNIKM